jgi:hypothetical protein
MYNLELANFGVLNLLWRAGHFLPQIVHTNSPTAPIWNILIM